MTTWDESHRRRRHSGRRARRKQVLDCLAAFGLTGRGRQPARRAANCPADTPYARRLRGALERLGPVAAAFGLYLSLRADLLPPPDCAELAGIAERPPATPPAAVRPVLISELGRPLGEVFSAFEEAPFDCGFQTQSHHAWLDDESPVVVKLLRPEWDEQWIGGAELLSPLAEALADSPWDGLPTGDLVDDFRRAVEDRADLSREADALTELADDPDGEGLRAPKVLRPLSTSGVLIYERPAGVRLSELPAGATGAGDAPAPVGGRESHVRRAAVHLGRAWLRLALHGRRFPLDLRPAEIVLQPDGALVLTGGPFATLPAESQARLAGYLVAAMAGDLDEACDLLLDELGPAPGSTGKEVVRRALRQVIPGQDTAGESPGRADGPDEYLFAHLRRARAEGHRPGAHLIGFVRGLAGTGSIGRRLSPGGAVFRDALAGLRIEAILSRFRDALTLRAVRERGPDCAALLLGLPQFLDQLLAPPSGPGRGHAGQEPAPDGRDHRPTRRDWPAALALAAGALLLYQQAPASLTGSAGGSLVWGVLTLMAAVVLLERLIGPR